MDAAAARVLIRTSLCADVFWGAAGRPDAGWQLALEDWRPGRSLCDRCGRPAGLLVVVIDPDAPLPRRLGEDCLGRLDLPATLVTAARRGLRAARGAGGDLDQPAPAEATELATWHPGIALALDHDLGVPRRWLTAARAARARSRMVDAGVWPEHAPTLDTITNWRAVRDACPADSAAGAKLADLMGPVMRGTGTPKQHKAAAKLLLTPWAEYRPTWPAGWKTWGVWPEQYHPDRRPRRSPRR